MPFLIPILIAGFGALTGAAATVVIGNSLDGVNETVSNTSSAVSKVGNTALLLGGLYVFAKYKKII